MITLIMAVSSNNEWATDEPVAYVLPLRPETMTDLEKKIETVKRLRNTPDLRDVEFRDCHGIWTKDKTFSELLEGEDFILTDIEIGDVDCGDVDLRVFRIWPGGAIHFIANWKYSGDEYYSATGISWKNLLSQIAELKGEPA
jgi:hypothetical protein